MKKIFTRTKRSTHTKHWWHIDETFLEFCGNIRLHFLNYTHISGSGRSVSYAKQFVTFLRKMLIKRVEMTNRQQSHSSISVQLYQPIVQLSYHVFQVFAVQTFFYRYMSNRGSDTKTCWYYCRLSRKLILLQRTLCISDKKINRQTQSKLIHWQFLLRIDDEHINNKMQDDTERKLQFERDLRVIQSNSIEPVVYQSNTSIVSSYRGEIHQVTLVSVVRSGVS